MNIHIAMSYALSFDLKKYMGHNKRPLISYYVVTTANRYEGDVYEYFTTSGRKFFLDSGAFSAHTRGVDISLNDYMKYIERNRTIVDRYANLDPIGDYKLTKDNQKIMEDAGFHPMPVYHAGEPLEVLEDYLNCYDYIAVGGMVEHASSREKMTYFLDQVFNKVKDYWPKKLHLFGLTASYHLKRYPAYSCDSSSPYSGGKFAKVWDLVSGSNYNPKKSVKGFQYLDRGTKKYWRRTSLMMDKTYELEAYITNLWKYRGVSWDGDGNYEGKKDFRDSVGRP